jgi:hypothetical protein
MTRRLLGTAEAVRGDPDRRRACRRLPHAPEDRTDQSEEVFDRDNQWHTLTCRQCGVATPAPRPPGAFGPRVTATVAVCTGVYHLSKRTTAGLLCLCLKG